MQSQIFHKHVEFPVCFLSEYIFFVFPYFFLSWHMYIILLINNLILSRSWPKYVDPNLMFIFD